MYAFVRLADGVQHALLLHLLGDGLPICFSINTGLAKIPIHAVGRFPYFLWVDSNDASTWRLDVVEIHIAKAPLVDG